MKMFLHGSNSCVRLGRLSMFNFSNSIAIVAVAMIVPFFVVADCAAQQRNVIVAVGAEGLPEYGEQFSQWADNWAATITESQTEDANLNLIRIGQTDGGKTDLEQLKAAIESTDESADELWVVLIGHGTDDRKQSKFNLRGSDVTATQINEWLEKVPCRKVIINCTSASGAFISKLKGGDRIVITATRSAAQHNFARFGRFLSEAIADPSLDLDKDQQTSLLEAFVAASARTQEFYVQETRLATELAMIDDNGDGLGTPANWFEGTRVVKKSRKGEPDGFVANQVFLVRGGDEAKLEGDLRKQRDLLEAKLESIRSKKNTYDEESYYTAIEPILLELAKIYQSVEE